MNNTLRESSVNGDIFKVGLFLGFDNNNRILLLGFSIMLNDDKNTISKIFKWFFELI
jgi:hypothetical protein